MGQIVTVFYDSKATPPTLKLDPTVLVLEADAPAIFAVAWQFRGIDELVAAGWLPSLRFDIDPLDQELNQVHLGPFTDLCTTSNAVVGCGFRLASKFKYRAVLVPPESSGDGAIITAPATLDASQVKPQSSAILVTGTNGTLQVEPERVSVYQGQALHWTVDPTISLSQSWFPRVIFDSGPSGATFNDYLGPFLSFQGDNVATNGLCAQGTKGSYSYRFQLVSESGEPIAVTSPDPTIDKEGDPSEDEGPGPAG